MPHRTQKGWLKQEKRKEGNTWMLFFRAVRKADGKRVENKIRIGLVKDFPSKDCARAEAERLQRHINPVDHRGAVTFSDLARHYIEHELSECPESIVLTLRWCLKSEITTCDLKMCWPNEREERDYSRAELIMAESGESAPKNKRTVLGDCGLVRRHPYFVLTM